jgi:peptidoglycan hydrolase CwlO-like protein
MKVSQLRQLIKEAIHDRLAMIDEAGNNAAIQAKIAKIQEDIQEAHGIKSNIPENIRHYVDTDIIEGMMAKLEESIEELEAKKTEYEEQMNEMTKPVKETKKKPSGKMTKKEKPMVGKKPRVGDETNKKSYMGMQAK